MIKQFYFLLWFWWALRVSALSIFFGIILSLLVTLFLYFFHGAKPMSNEVFSALQDIFLFWFSICWSISLLMSLFVGLKYIFNRCYGRYKLQLLDCPSKEVLDHIYFTDLVRVWRKWFMITVWIVGVEMIFAIAIHRFFFSEAALFEWFGIYTLYGFILLSGLGSFALMIFRCDKVRMVQC